MTDKRARRARARRRASPKSFVVMARIGDRRETLEMAERAFVVTAASSKIAGGLVAGELERSGYGWARMRVARVVSDVG